MEKIEKTNKLKVLNAFPLGATPKGCSIYAEEISIDEAKELLQDGYFQSYIGHSDTSQILTNLLGVKIEQNRTNAIFIKNETVLVAAYSGPRLPEGSTTLPEGAEFRFFKVLIYETGDGNE